MFLSLIKCSFVCRPRPYLYRNDHRYPGVNTTNVPVAILYAEIGTKKFNTLHKLLSEKADEGKVTYVLRHFLLVSLSTVPHYLVGNSVSCPKYITIWGSVLASG